MGMYGQENVEANLGENVVSEVSGVNTQNVSGIGGSNEAGNTTENAVKEGFASWKMYLIIGAAGLVIIVLALIAFMCKKKKAEVVLDFDATSDEPKQISTSPLLFPQQQVTLNDESSSDKKTEPILFNPVLESSSDEKTEPIDEKTEPILFNPVLESSSDEKIEPILFNPVKIVPSASFGQEDDDESQMSKLRDFLILCYDENYDYEDLKNDLAGIDISEFRAENVQINSGSVNADTAYAAIVELINNLNDEHKDAKESIKAFKSTITPQSNAHA